MLSYLGLGSNLSANVDAQDLGEQVDPAERLDRAIQAMNAWPHTAILAKSSKYRTEPIGSVDHCLDGQPDFCNAVVAIDTQLPPLELLRHCQKLEQAQQRIRPHQWAARTLDVDVLLYGQQFFENAELSIPHPRIGERRFVLEPLAELDATLNLPGIGVVADALQLVADQRLSRW